ncbi:MAG TPA: hypothetical protein VF933_31995 [Streptosporangiaceae bacterium]
MTAMRPDQAKAAREPVSTDHPGAHRLNRLQAALTVAVLVVAVGAVLYALFGSGGVLRSSPSAPGWRPGAAPCPASPLAHVHDPGRLEVVAKCATASGIVQQVEYKPGDGDWQVLVAVDPPYRRFLTPADHGLLPARVIPADLPDVALPALGQRATFYGTWVINKNLHGRAELHPVWRIVVPNAAPGSAPGGPAGSHAGPGRLVLTVAAPASVAVGAPFTLQVRCRLIMPGKTIHASQVHLFMEIINSRGLGVRWKAGSTNSLGRADLRLVALDAPGSFTVHIYASKSGRFRNAEQNLMVRRR